MEPLFLTLSLSEFESLPTDGPTPTPFVLDDGRERSMHFSFFASQSRMRLRRPNALVDAYTRKMMSFLLFVPEPRHVVLIGLGGGSLAKFCYARLPNTQITAVEINADVLALREKFKIPRDDLRFCVVHDDGAHFIENSRDNVDALLIDAFDANGIAKSLLDPQFSLSCARRLADGGIVVLNLCGERWRYFAIVEQMRAAFAGRVCLVPVANSGNVLLFAFADRIGDPRGAGIEGHAANLRARLHLNFPRYLRRFRAAQFPILVFDPDGRRGRRLATVLRQHGLAVTLAYHTTEVLHSLKTAYFQVLVVTLDLENSNELQRIETFRRNAPRSWLLVASEHTARVHRGTVHKYGADALIDFSVGLEEVSRRVELLQLEWRATY